VVHAKFNVINWHSHVDFSCTYHQGRYQLHTNTDNEIYGSYKSDILTDIMKADIRVITKRIFHRVRGFPCQTRKDQEQIAEMPSEGKSFHIMIICQAG